MKELKHKGITGKIIGAAFEVYKFLGNGFTHGCVLFLKGIHGCCAFQACLPKGTMAYSQEVIYQRVLAWELSQAGLSYAREIEQEIFYKGQNEPIGTRRADFVVEGKVLVELKAIRELENVHLAQILNYLKAFKLKVGLLINFGAKSLKFKRLVS